MKFKKIITSIVLMVLVFLCLFIPKSNANFFFDDDETASDIEKTIDEDEGGLFEKIIAKTIGGIAEGVFDLTTNDTFGVGFKEYDELVFGNTENDIAPFTDEQWYKTMQWYKAMTVIAGVPMLIAVIVLAYKIIVGGFSVDKRQEAKDNILRLFFGATSIALAPLFVKFLLYLNNNLVRILVVQSNGSIDSVLGNSLLSNIRTGNAILTALVIAMFAYLFVKINIKFIIRQFTIIIFTIFTPIISVMWIINRRAIGASIWFGQILINVFMQFIYAFLFLVYLNFLPETSGWAVSLLWAMMILPLAEVLQNTLQNLISRIAGLQGEELTNRGIGMAASMAYTLKAFAYQFKGIQNTNSSNSNLGFAKTFMNNTSFINGKPEEQSFTTPVQTKEVITNPITTKTIETNPIRNNDIQNGKDIKFSNEMNKKDIINDKYKSSPMEKASNAGGTFFKAGMYMAEGRDFSNPSYNNRKYNRENINNTRITDIRKEQEQNTTANLEMEKFNDK